MHRALTFSFVFLVACASNMAQRPKEIAQPSIEPRLASPLFFGSYSSAPATIEVLIRNNAKVPIVVRRIEVDSPGMAMFTIVKSARTFRETIPPGETKALTVFATATTTRSNPTEPLAMRAIVDFESGPTVWREMVMQR